ncbi:hypothetical protein [Terrarubrum flagellatum]|uniref:hypothetical protein n=1 Tax=Terrirubrum flagellatum TaxID=2895980 RepID=UPI0031456265
MCDYSLHQVASTPAKVGDKLKSSAFPHTSTRGFTSVEDPNVAVCLRPGTEIAFEKNIECDRAMGFLPHRKFPARVARFRQVNLDQPYAHHDALELPDGRIVLVTQLREGQMATVLQLPAAPIGEEVKPEETKPQEATPSPETVARSIPSHAWF